MKFEFVNLNSSQTGAHVKVLANNKEVGILYLNDEELEALLDLIHKGSVHSDAHFVNSLSEDSDFDDLED
ncbi:MAG: hypothetical protein EBU90_21550 [Proteobacteria bacterium]|nr:hypothetical protein [Pseudomonadota bacterium]NBP15622.1 hypothetical protein [bacterium]